MKNGRSPGRGDEGTEIRMSKRRYEKGKGD
jgi:hypothetical protein